LKNQFDQLTEEKDKEITHLEQQLDQQALECEKKTKEFTDLRNQFDQLVSELAERNKEFATLESDVISKLDTLSKAMIELTQNQLATHSKLDAMLSVQAAASASSRAIDGEALAEEMPLFGSSPDPASVQTPLRPKPQKRGIMSSITKKITRKFAVGNRKNPLSNAQENLNFEDEEKVPTQDMLLMGWNSYKLNFPKLKQTDFRIIRDSLLQQSTANFATSQTYEGVFKVSNLTFEAFYPDNKSSRATQKFKLVWNAEGKAFYNRMTSKK